MKARTFIRNTILCSAVLIASSKAFAESWKVDMLGRCVVVQDGKVVELVSRTQCGSTDIKLDMQARCVRMKPDGTRQEFLYRSQCGISNYGYTSNGKCAFFRPDGTVQRYLTDEAPCKSTGVTDPTDTEIASTDAPAY